MHGISHKGMVLPNLRSLILPTLIRVKQQVVGWTSSVCIAILCRFVLRLFMCLLMQDDSKWRHVSF